MFKKSFAGCGNLSIDHGNDTPAIRHCNCKHGTKGTFFVKQQHNHRFTTIANPIIMRKLIITSMAGAFRTPRFNLGLSSYTDENTGNVTSPTMPEILSAGSC